ncbi:MAG: MFS transporter [Deltaproteobacteria bacterium]|nr:MFS transporter [Deltaproteobacteria bacterium]
MCAFGVLTKPLIQSLRTTFAALYHKNYRYWFIGQVISILGTFMQITAQGFLIYQLTRSPAYLGYVAFVAGVPAWFFNLYGGVVADRIPQRLLLLTTQSIMMLLAFILAALTYCEIVQPWHILVLAFCLGIANSFDAPARHAFVAELVPRVDLGNAIALNSTIFNIGTTVGPSIAGMLYVWFGPAWCFFINGLSFVAVLVALAIMRLSSKIKIISTASARREIILGLLFVWRHRVIRTLILGIMAISFFGFAIITLMPAWATEVLHGDARTNGWLLTARGLGSLIGALMIAAYGRQVHRGRHLSMVIFILPIAQLVFSAAHILSISLIFLLLTGWSVMIFMNMTNTVIQMNVADELRGRVLSIYTLSFFGMMPIGGLVVGALATHIGVPITIALCSIILLIYAILVRVYVPELAKQQ